MWVGFFSFAATLILCLGAAQADSIDGNWCKDKAQRFTIQGPTIITPGGARVQGNYGRHDFVYVVPAGEPGAGKTVRMVLMGEEHVRVQEGDAASVVWDRCGPSVS